MKKAIVFLTLIFLPFVFTSSALARSGCCSWHGGVRADGCGCNDGSSLSSTCAPYYTCTAPQQNTAPAASDNTYTQPAYVAPTDAPTTVPPTPIPTPYPTATPYPTETPTPLPTATPTPKPTLIPTSKPTATPTNTPTIIPTTAVLGATKTSASDVWVGLIALLVLLGLFGGFCFGLYKLSKFLFKQFKMRFLKV